RKLVDQERAAIVLREDAGIAPALAGQRPGILLRNRPDIENVDNQQVTRLGAFDGNRPGQGMGLGYGRIADVIGGVIVLDGTIEPLAAIEAKRITRLDMNRRRDFRMIAIMTQDFLVGEGLVGIKRKYLLGHGFLL